MRQPLLFAATLAIAASAAGGAAAQTGAKILTAGGAKERVVMTAGVTVQNVNGVRLYRGAPTPEEPAAAEPKSQTTVIVNVPPQKCIWRTFRHLRTQGFYSGTGPQSRRYTQGFYSGQ